MESVSWRPSVSTKGNDGKQNIEAKEVYLKKTIFSSFSEVWKNNQKL